MEYTDKQIMQYLEMNAHFRKFASTIGINSTKLELMLYLGANGFDKGSEGSNIKDIGERTNLLLTSLSQNLSDLWKSKLVDKSICQENQRERRVKLTLEGERVYEEAKKSE